MNRRAFMGGFIGATMAPVLPVAVMGNMAARQFREEMARVYNATASALDDFPELKFDGSYLRWVMG